MKCRKYERWISDDLDGRLTAERKAALDNHLASCPSCRAHRREIGRLQAEAPELFDPARGPEYWDGFTRRLGRRLAARGDSGITRRGAGVLGRRWAWAAIGALFFAAVGVRVLVVRKPGLPEQPVLSHEESLAAFLGDVQSDPDLIEAFSAYIETALREEAGLDTLEPVPRFRDDPLFWESVSDEELVSLERELRTQYRLTEVSHEVF